MFKGDVVGLKRQGEQILYRVDKVENDKIILKGLYCRTTVVINRESEELEVINEQDTINFANNAIKANESKIKEILKERNNKLPIDKNFMKPKLLHLDADKNYLAICMKFYEVMDIEA